MLIIAVAAVSAGVASQSWAKGSHAAGTGYSVRNLVSDGFVPAEHVDANLVNGWGISFAPTGPFWISANGTGFSMIYTVTNDSLGNPQVTKSGLQVSIPGEGTPTGQVFDETGSFNGDSFLFASEDGTISGWRSTGSSAAVPSAARCSSWAAATWSSPGAPGRR